MNVMCWFFLKGLVSLGTHALANYKPQKFETNEPHVLVFLLKRICDIVFTSKYARALQRK
jgi:hypothetical protein